MTDAKLADEIELSGYGTRLALLITKEHWQQIIAALRQPSSDKVLVPMAVVEALSDLTELKKIKRLIEKGEATNEQCHHYEGRKEYSWRFAERAIEEARAVLSAAEAEGRKT